MARTWLPVVGGVLLVALIGALAWWGWQSWETSKAEKAAVAYQTGLEALEAGNPAAADVAFTQAVDNGNAAYKSLALQQRAGVAVANNKIPEAIAFLDEAAKADGDELLADPARLKAAMLLMDTGTLADIEARLTPLTQEGRPLRPFAQEALAMARLQNGQLPQARELFVLLSLGQDIPESIQQKASAAIAMIDSGAAAGLADIVKAQAALPVQTPGAAAQVPAAGPPTAPQTAQ
nr:tetratricopeptide repeat protein [Brevundimonas variabilis]